MAKYECKVCGYIYNEQHASRSFEELAECPICNEGKENFIALDAVEETDEPHVKEEVFEEKQEATDDFVVERRQEFWSPAGNRTETIVADEDKEEDVVDSSYNSRIESFYSSAEPVGMAHIISNEEEKEFKPLWNSGSGTVQRVIDPFGDRSEPVVKADNIGMVMPAEEPTVEEILGEEPEIPEVIKEEPVAEVIEESVVEEVFFAEDEKDNAMAEEVIPEAAEEDFVAEKEDIIVEEEVVSTEEEVVSETEEMESKEYFLDEEEDEDDFFSEVVMDHFMEAAPTTETFVEEPVADEVISEVVEEGASKEIVEEFVADADVAEVVPETAEGVVEESVQEAPRIKAWSFLDDVLEAGTVVGAGTVGAAMVADALEEEKEMVEEEEVIPEEEEETLAEEIFAEPEVTEEEPKKESNDSYDFFTEEIRKARAVGVYTPLRVGEVDLRDTFDDDEDEAEEVIEAQVEEVVEETVAKEVEAEVKKEEVTYCNNLEKILILPAQLNPMPLPEAVKVEGRTVLGIGADRPLVLDNPVFSTGAYNMVQYVPNSGLTSEDYQKADAIEIVVGKGNGIEKNINSKEDLRQVVNFLRLESDGCPIGIKLGAGRIERDLEFCIFAKPDYVVLNNFDVVPLPYALHRATKFLNTVQSDIDIVIALDGVKDSEELAKIVAMGADVIALRNQPSDMNAMIDELKNHARVTGHYEVQDLNVKDLCTTDREIAEYTDIYHV